MEDHLNLMLPQSFFQETQFSSSSKKNDTSVLTLKLPEQSHSRALIITLAPDLPEPSIRYYGEQSQSQSHGNQLATSVPDTAYVSLASVERRQGQAILQSCQQDPSGINGSPFNYTFE